MFALYVATRLVGTYTAPSPSAIGVPVNAPVELSVAIVLLLMITCCRFVHPPNALFAIVTVPDVADSSTTSRFVSFANAYPSTNVAGAFALVSFVA